MRETVLVHCLQNSLPTCYSDVLCTEAVLSCSCGLDLKNIFFKSPEVLCLY